MRVQVFKTKPFKNNSKYKYFYHTYLSSVRTDVSVGLTIDDKYAIEHLLLFSFCYTYQREHLLPATQLVVRKFARPIAMPGSMITVS